MQGRPLFDRNMEGRRALITVPWSRLRGIGNSAAAKATILIPLVGYLFLFNDHFIGWLQLHDAVAPSIPTDSDGTELSWRLLFLYYGLTFVAMATIVYALSCPHICKRYADSVEFSRHVQEVHASQAAFAGLVNELQHKVNMANRVPNNILNAAEDELKLLRDTAAAEAWESLQASERPSVLLRLLVAKYNLMDFERRVFRGATAALYVVGLAMLAIPAAQLFYRVTIASIDLICASVGA